MTDSVKHILLPTDFGQCAANAMRLAILWNTVMPVHLHFFHRIRGMPAGWDTLEEDVQSEHGQLVEAIDQANAAFATWKELLEANDVPHELHLAGGSIADFITEYLATHPVDYVFIGSHGDHQRKYERLGAHAEQIVRAVPRPVLIAKEETRGQIKQVIFASTFDERAKRSFVHFLSMIEAFNPEIHLLNVDTPSFYIEPRALIIPAMKEFEEVAQGFNCTLHMHPDSSIARGILEYSKEAKADLVALAEHSDRLFHSHKLNKSLKRLIHFSGVPVLFIDQPEDKA